ncbi:hypothetical protein Pan181_39410 [Aeoliella mucimassa]|uniref:Uncharacterized protein n=1 Tax=Aeoliella mucimassa TaxID=2527972 RepID=A0A518ASL2_9BACT|nr:hypothetical protein Pan181_39410 [Aeoliella mucimassa]
MGKCLFNVAAAVSLAVCLVTAGFWARSLGHFEQISVSRISKPHPDEAHVSTWQVRWYSNTLRFHASHSPLPASDVEKQREGVSERAGNTPSYRTGWKYSFEGDDNTRFMEAPTPGFGLRHPSAGSGHWFLTLSVRPWLPTLIASVLPLTWYLRFRRANRSHRSWQFSLREMLVMVVVVSLLLGVAVWLKH